jgi:CxxC motif-containing protein (DUF1111 family)
LTADTRIAYSLLKMKMVFISTLALALAAAACGDNARPAATDATPSTIVRASDVPIDGLSAADVAAFEDGDALFDLPFTPADGLGPLYVRPSCGSCHADGSRGPGLVQKMAIVEADGITADPDQSALPYGHSIRAGLAAGATTPVEPPPGANVRISVRVGPPVLGRGYIEAVDDAAIAAMAANEAARTDGIHGVMALSPFASVPNPDTAFSSYQTGQTVIGHFALKARIATVDDFVADAFQGDMGLTTPMRPTELPNPDGLTDDLKPGVDLDIDHVNRIAFYVRRIAIPKRVGLTEAGRALFDQLACSACHVPSMPTRASYPIPQLAGIAAEIYSDLLLHDMGDGLADGMTDGGATSRQWRTAPLIGVRFAKEFLHDGRAPTVQDAILAHGGEALAAANAFRALSAADRQTLLAFVEAL